MNGVTPLLLGLDPSKSRLGWALIHLETGEPVVAGTESLDVKNGGWLHEQVRNAILGAVFWRSADSEIEVVVREEPTTSFVRVAKDHGAVCALVDAECRRRWPHAPLWTLMPSEWRKLAGLPGNANKDDIMVVARLLAEIAAWPRDYSWTQDAADALLIARAGWHQWHTSDRTEGT